jgi:hypothetical protein
MSEVWSWVDRVRAALAHSAELLETVTEQSLQTSEHPEAWHRAGFASMLDLLDAKALQLAVDRELAAFGRMGSEFLEGWQTVARDSDLEFAPVRTLAAALLGEAPEAQAAQVRAMPTRQLHITAGNSPQIPLVSAVRGIATKSYTVVKLPSGALGPGALAGLAAAAAAPGHPLTEALSFVYWRGGDRSLEEALMAPGMFDRIVVWGAPDSVSSVQRRAVGTRVLTFNPRYGISLVGHAALADGVLQETARRAVTDSLIANQKACIASQIHYVEGSLEDATRYAEALHEALAPFDQQTSQSVPDVIEGHLTRLRRGRLLDADWLVRRQGGAFQSAVVVSAEPLPVALLPMSRFVLVRPVSTLGEVLPWVHPGVASASVAPEAARMKWRNALAARGVSNVTPLGEAGRMFPGMPHDGMLALSQLVDWKNA